MGLKMGRWARRDRRQWARPCGQRGSDATDQQSHDPPLQVTCNSGIRQNPLIHDMASATITYLGSLEPKLSTLKMGSTYV
jgi:hypothetical protein